MIGNEGAIYLGVCWLYYSCFFLIFFSLMLDGGSRVSIYPRDSPSLRQQQHWRRTETGASACLCLGGGDLIFSGVLDGGEREGESATGLVPLRRTTTEKGWWEN